VPVHVTPLLVEYLLWDLLSERFQRSNHTSGGMNDVEVKLSYCLVKDGTSDAECGALSVAH
jgi:hypothetical protein